MSFYCTTHPMLYVKIKILLFYGRCNEVVISSLTRRNFFTMNFSFMTSDSGWIFEFHIANLTCKIFARPMNRAMNVEHIFRSETCATNLTWEWPEMFVQNSVGNSNATISISHLSPVCTRM